MATVPAERARSHQEGGASRPPRNNARFVVQAPTERRRARWLRRRTYQRFLDWQAAQLGSWDELPGRRQAGCGRCGWADSVDVRATITDDGANAYPVGVQTCGSVWACAVCSAKVRTRRSMEVSLAAIAHSSAGGGLAMLTLTVRHERRHDLGELVAGLRASFRTLQQHRQWRPLRGRLVGTITSMEVTVGPNGWHPHLHVLLFLDGDDDQVLGELAEWTPAAWRSIVGGKLDVAPDLAHGVHVMRLDATAAAYVAKIADETTRADLKDDARSPWALLDAMADGEAEGIARWNEYVVAMKGKRAIRWSPGLRDRFGIADRTDEDLAAEQVDGVLLDVVPLTVWRTWASTINADGLVEAVARLEAYEAPLRRSDDP
jgi:hypothetical protein